MQVGQKWKMGRDPRQNLTADIHNDDIGTDFPDIFKGNDIFRFTAEERTQSVVSRNNDFADLPGAFIEFQITDFPQTFTILQINDLFAF